MNFMRVKEDNNSKQTQTGVGGGNVGIRDCGVGVSVRGDGGSSGSHASRKVANNAGSSSDRGVGLQPQSSHQTRKIMVETSKGCAKVIHVSIEAPTPYPHTASSAVGGRPLGHFNLSEGRPLGHLNLSEGRPLGHLNLSEGRPLGHLNLSDDSSKVRCSTAPAVANPTPTAVAVNPVFAVPPVNQVCAVPHVNQVFAAPHVNPVFAVPQKAGSASSIRDVGSGRTIFVKTLHSSGTAPARGSVIKTLPSFGNQGLPSKATSASLIPSSKSGKRVSPASHSDLAPAKSLKALTPVSLPIHRAANASASDDFDENWLDSADASSCEFEIEYDYDVGEKVGSKDGEGGQRSRLKKRRFYPSIVGVGGGYDTESHLVQKKKKKTNEGKSDTEKSHEKNDYGWPCKECNVVFPTHFLLRRHQTVHIESRPFQCEVCSASYDLVSDLNTHMVLKHPTVDRPYACGEEGCDMRFRFQDSLKRHSVNHQRERPYACNYCPKVFCTVTELKFHVAIHPDKQAYKCALCAATFAFPQGLASHLRCHTSVKPYQCTQAGCAAVFALEVALRKHLQCHSGCKQYHCMEPGCPATFNNIHQLETHEETHQKKRKQRVSGEVPEGVCCVCHQSFASKRALSMHLRMNRTCRQVSSMLTG
jgi:hypothetical protein